MDLDAYSRNPYSSELNPRKIIGHAQGHKAENVEPVFTPGGTETQV